MSQIESFVNSGCSLEPLELAHQGGAAVLCTPAFVGAFVGVSANYALNYAVDWYLGRHNGGGHFAPGVVDVDRANEASSDELLDLLVTRF